MEIVNVVALVLSFLLAIIYLPISIFHAGKYKQEKNGKFLFHALLCGFFFLCGFAYFSVYAIAESKSGFGWGVVATNLIAVVVCTISMLRWFANDSGKLSFVNGMLKLYIGTLVAAFVLVTLFLRFLI